MSRENYVYILANKFNTLVYVGSTSNLVERVAQHKSLGGGYTAKYRITKLVWFEVFPDYNSAYAFERKLKGWKRAWKDALIEKDTPDWEELVPE